jgi:hypothetical protein
VAEGVTGGVAPGGGGYDRRQLGLGFGGSDTGREEGERSGGVWKKKREREERIKTFWLFYS